MGTAAKVLELRQRKTSNRVPLRIGREDMLWEFVDESRRQPLQPLNTFCQACRVGTNCYRLVLGTRACRPV